MSLINFQSVFYFVHKPSNGQLINSLSTAILVLNQEMGTKLKPMNDIDIKILEGDLEEFQNNGKQLFLIHSDKQEIITGDEWILYISFIDEFQECTAIQISSELTELTEQLINLSWNRILNITKILVRLLTPLIAQINGLDEEVGGQVISPKTVKPKKLPSFFTPYTYLDNSLVSPLTAQKLELLDAYAVEKLVSGWSIQLIEDFYSQASDHMKESIRSLDDFCDIGYRQTPIEP